MTKSRRTRAPRDASSWLLEKGAGALVLGAAMLIAPLFLGGHSSPIMSAVSTGLRGPALLALGLGLLMCAAALLFRRLKGTRESTPTGRAKAGRPPVSDADRAAGDFSGFRSGYEPSRVMEDIEPDGPPRVRQKTWSERVFDDIEWRRFEALCEALFAQAGFETQSQSHGADGGVDIWLFSRNAQGPAAVVQCKHWRGRPVGVKQVREFFGVMASKSLKRGTFATSSTFTDDALRFCKENGISALDAGRLLELIARRTPEQQFELLDVAYEGAYWQPTCANCGIKMVARTRRKTTDRFWGCTNYPRCRATLPMRAG
jgi:restriction system protein